MKDEQMIAIESRLGLEQKSKVLLKKTSLCYNILVFSASASIGIVDHFMSETEKS